MYLKFLSLCFLLCNAHFLLAQFKIEGAVIDQKTRLPLENANVLVQSLTDSTFFAGEATNENGKFTIKELKEGLYSIEVSFLGYEKLKVERFLLNSDVVLDSFALPEDSDLLSTIVVEATVLRVVQNGDTTEYNAGAFKTAKGSTAEDLVKKMPGFTVENGQVKQNGENVRSVTIDGKKFYGDDVTAALRNTPADIVDKVQVFEFSNDMLFLFGGEMNFGEKGINLVTKKGMSDAYIGNFELGYGTDDRYLAKGNFNRYKNYSRFAAMWNVNNINVVDVDYSSFSNRGGGGGVGRRGRNNNPASMFNAGNSGITDLYTGGLAYTSEFGKKLSLTATYFFTYSENNNLSTIERTYFTTPNIDAQLLYSENNTAKSYLRAHRANLNLVYNIDSNQRIIFAPTLNYTNSDNRNLFSGLNFYNNNDSLNSTNTNSTNLNDNLNPSAQLSYTRKFDKIGRKMEVSVNARYSDQVQADGQASNNFFYETDTATAFNQLANTNTQGRSANSVINYFEPVALGHVLQFSYNNTFNFNSNDKLTNNFSEVSQQFDQLDTLLSNNFNSLYQLHRVGVNYNYKAQDDKLNIEFGLSQQYALLDRSQIFPRPFELNKPFYNVLPTAGIRYKFNKTTNMRLSYRSSTNPPSANQLQDVVDNSNPLLLTSGNSQLKQNFTHNVGFRFSTTNPKTSVNFSFGSWSNITTNYVTNYTIIASSDTIINAQSPVKLQKGAQYLFPVNAGNYYSVRNYFNYSFPLTKIKSNFNINGSVNYTQTPAIINQITNLSNNFNIGGGFYLGSNISENIDFSVSYWANYNDIRNTNNTANNSKFYTHNIFASLKYTVWKGLHFTANAINTVNSGLGAGFNQNIVMLSSSLGYKFGKDRNAEIKLSVFDALLQNQSIARNTTETYWEDTQNLVLTRYFMVYFTYNLRKFKTDDKNAPTEPFSPNQGDRPRRPRPEQN